MQLLCTIMLSIKFTRHFYKGGLRKESDSDMAFIAFGHNTPEIAPPRALNGRWSLSTACASNLLMMSCSAALRGLGSCLKKTPPSGTGDLSHRCLRCKSGREACTGFTCTQRGNA